MRARCLVPLVLVAALLVQAGGLSPPGTKIKALLMGKVMPQYPPASWFSYEPLVDYALIPTGVFGSFSFPLDEARRSVRIYFPRTRERIEEYDFFTFRGVYMEALSGTQVENTKSAVTRDGAGAFLEIGGITKNWGEGVNWPWVESTLAPVFPNDPMAGELWTQNLQGNLPYKVVVNQDPSLPPVIRMFLPFGIETVRGSWYILLIVPQPGATVWGWARGAYPGVLGEDPPWLLSWKYGGAMTWSAADSLDTPWWDGSLFESDQEYGLDIMMNIILHSLGRPLPKDVVLPNAVRQQFALLADRMSSLASYLDFIERFGVSSSRLEGAREEVEALVQKAVDSYLEGEYQLALDDAREAGTALHAVEQKAARWKDQALLWIYVIEWTIVTATMMVTGYILYALMLRRRLYKEVRTTRMLG
jgi:hypothetical protein